MHNVVISELNIFFSKTRLHFTSIGQAFPQTSAPFSYSAGILYLSASLELGYPTKPQLQGKHDSKGGEIDDRNLANRALLGISHEFSIKGVRVSSMRLEAPWIICDGILSSCSGFLIGTNSGSSDKLKVHRIKSLVWQLIEGSNRPRSSEGGMAHIDMGVIDGRLMSAPRLFMSLQVNNPEISQAHHALRMMFLACCTQRDARMY